jgi:prepilin signal peptidase PulO-like enzyme (type II secretory pathway)
VELLSSAAFVYLWARSGLSWEMLGFAGVYCFFSLIAIVDLKYRLVPNALTYPAIAIILIVQLLIVRQDALAVLLGGLLAFAIFFLTALLKPGHLGGGDVKLAALIGLAFGFPQVLWALVAGAGVGGLTATWLLLTRRWSRESHIPYAPFLCLGAMVALLYDPLPWILP